ncbi:MAG TPA: TlpA disulfide reductase family protein [Candidatus Angelobacter sp.]|jgi:thiol-disulfide isomerase/thioredoxin
MRYAAIALLLACTFVPLRGQDKLEEPKDEKAQKTYNEGLDHLKQHKVAEALDNFKKADKQDGGHCLGCQRKLLKYGSELGEWKVAENAAEEMVAQAEGNNAAIAHYQFGLLMMNEALIRRKDDFFSRAHDEMTKALAINANFPSAVYADGRALAHMKQDDAAKIQFERFVKMRPEGDLDRQRALRYISQPELARAKMSPPFVVTTLDGKRVSMDDLKGKVVLLDFWATWCGPCREALPHMQSIAKKFDGQPLVVLSVSLDNDEQKWKDYIEKNKMTWLQYRDGGFEGSVARMFAVNAIPHTFTIDADGVLQDERIGDASIEGKLKKLVARAKELQATEKQPAEQQAGTEAKP